VKYKLQVVFKKCIGFLTASPVFFFTEVSSYQGNILIKNEEKIKNTKKVSYLLYNRYKYNNNGELKKSEAQMMSDLVYQGT
jgi:hypothetical protein